MVGLEFILGLVNGLISFHISDIFHQTKSSFINLELIHNIRHLAVFFLLYHSVFPIRFSSAAPSRLLMRGEFRHHFSFLLIRKWIDLYSCLSHTDHCFVSVFCNADCWVKLKGETLRDDAGKDGTVGKLGKAGLFV